MPEVYVIADLHFGHKKAAEIRGFPDPQAHDDAIVKAWNEVVTKRDVVYVLGDVFRLDRVPELLGIKKLALGNHDQYQPEKYAPLFSKVQGCFEFDDSILTHIPIHPCQFPRYRLNVHGHLHDRPLLLNDPRYRNVSWEKCPEGKPRLLREVLR